MVERAEFEDAIRSTTRHEARVAILGALLANDTKLGHRLVIVGGSAIEIRTRGEYVSEDVDVVGGRRKIVESLGGWGFTRKKGSRGRMYWTRDDFGLAVDPSSHQRYSGFEDGILTIQTPYGSVRVAAAEDLIVRQLVFWSRDGRKELIDQAVVLYLDTQDRLDMEYLHREIRYQRIGAAWTELLRLAAASS